MKEIEQATNGQVKITPYFATALSTLEENYDSVVTGIADMGESFIGAKVGRLPLIENLLGTSLPSLRMKNASDVVWTLYQSSPALQDEFSEVKLLFLHASPPQVVCTSEKQVRSIADIKGLKYQVSGGALPTEIAAALGASVVRMPMGDIYMALEKGVIDGTTADYELMVARKWGDVCKYYTTVCITTSTFYCIMNKDKFNSLPPDVQKVFDDLSGDHAVELFGKARWQIDTENKETWEKTMGGTTIYLSEAELAKADALAKPVIDKYVDEMVAKGYPYRELYEKFLELAQQQSIPWP